MSLFFPAGLFSGRYQIFTGKMFKSLEKQAFNPVLSKLGFILAWMIERYR